VRTHSGTDRADTQSKGSAKWCKGGELAVELTRLALHRFGVSGAELRLAVQGVRAGAGADDRGSGWVARPGRASPTHKCL
jgi:hypothetical protein